MMRRNLLLAVSTLAVAAVFLNNAPLLGMDPALEAWTDKGCPIKILELTTTMEAQYKVRALPGRYCMSPREDCCTLLQEWIAHIMSPAQVGAPLSAICIAVKF